MNDILVSTITPCFRMKRYLKKFLEELPKQTMFDQMEVVLDHNEPDDEEIAWVQEFQGKYPGRIKHIIVTKVDPIGISMNRCIKGSSGEFLTIWNIDDLRTDNSIELQYKKIIENDDIGIVYGDYLIVKSFGSKKGEKIDCSLYDKKALSRSMLFGPFFMFRKSLCDKVGYFDEQFRTCADFDFALKIFFNSNAAYVSGLLGFYLNEGMGASTKPSAVLSPETTVINLRYGLFDKLDYNLVALATIYNIRYSLIDKNWVFIGEYIKNYEEMINDRKKMIKKGINLFVLKKVMMLEGLIRRKNKIKNNIPVKIIQLYKKLKFLKK